MDYWDKQKNSLKKELFGLGYSSLSEFLSANPQLSYLALADLLDRRVSAACIYMMQFEEAQTSLSATREVAKDALVRVLCGTLRFGWNKGVRFPFNKAMAYGEWYSKLPSHIYPELEIIAERVWDELEMANPPDGWRPSGLMDEYIQLAFRKGWPVEKQE